MSGKLVLSGISGVPETMLWPLHNRAAEARRGDALLDDPEAVRIADAIDYDYVDNFRKPNFGHIMRALSIDGALWRWMETHPGGQVVALGEGLETQFHRVDDGKVRWLAVDLDEAISVRERFLPDTDRHRNLRCSALDPSWMEEVDADDEVCVTMAGLLMYFEPGEVKELVRSIAERFARAVMLFDIIPRWFAKKTLGGWKWTENYTLPPMPFGMDRDELQEIESWHPNIAEVTQAPGPKVARGFLFRVLAPILEHTPWIKNKIPTVACVGCRPPDKCAPSSHPNRNARSSQ